MGQLISRSGKRFLTNLNRQGILKDDELELCLAADRTNDPNMLLAYFTYKPELETKYCPICSMPSSMCAFPNQHEQHWYKSGLQLHKWQVQQLLCTATDVRGNYASTILLLGGPGCGKSTFLALGLGWLLCAMNPGFINLTAAPSAKQNDAVKTEYKKWLKGTRGWEVFMSDPPSVARPIFKYLYRNGSEHRIFTTAALSGGDKAAKRNLSLEGDVVAYDEAGIDENFHQSLRVLGTRTRGLRPDGSHRGMVYPDGELRPPMFIISNPHPDNLEFDEYVSVTSEMDTMSLVEIDINANKALTDNQVDAVTQRVVASFLISGGTEEDAMNALAGRQGEGDGEVFTRRAIDGVISEDYIIDEYITSHLIGSRRKDTNFTFLLPKQNGHRYLITCDPGVAGAPRRNSPVIMLWDITQADRAILKGLYWGSPISGEALYLSTLAEWILRFRAFAYVDTTGPQAVLLDSKRLVGVEKWIVPVDMSGSLKGTAQWLMQMAANRSTFILPKLSPPYTFKRYLRRYRWNDDKITQDLVVGIMLLALWQHTVIGFGDDSQGENNEDDNESEASKRHATHVRGQTIATR